MRLVVLGAGEKRLEDGVQELAATARGKVNSPSLVPRRPHCATSLPTGEKTFTRW